jgi:fructose-bisphosphate aldolase class II
MALVRMSQLLKKAKEKGYGIGAFSVSNMEMIMGTIKAAEELNAPIILQVAQIRLPYSPIELFGPMMVAAANNAKVPVAVHFDHGTDLEVIHKALELGFTSVMIDASTYPIEENINVVKKVKDMAKVYHADVEAEVGQLPVSEDGKKEVELLFSNPHEVKMLYDATNVEAIALSIGNAHGLYKKTPKLNFEVLEQARNIVPIPLVLHGGSGISDEDFRRCIRQGIQKINVATITYQSVENSVHVYYKRDERSYFSMSSSMEKGAYESVKRHIEIFESVNKA